MAGSPVAGAAPTDGRLFTPAFLALSFAELAYFTAEGLTIPVAPLFARGPIGASVEGVGLAVGAFSVTALVLRPYAGRLSDRVGRRPLLVGGALAYAAVMVATALVDSLPALVALRLALGAAEAFFFVAGFAAVADLAPPGRTGEALSFNSLSLYLGIAIGPVLGGLLLDAGGFTMAWLGAAVLALLAAALAWWLPETSDPSTRTADERKAPLFQRAAIGPSFALFSGIAAMAGFFAFVALHAVESLRFDGASAVLLAFGLVVVGLRVSFARLPDRVPPFRLGTLALALCASGLMIVGLVPTVPGLFLGAVVLAAGVAFITPAMFTAIFARVQPSERGSASGTASLFLDLAFGGGPMLLGLVAGTAGMSVAFVVGASIAALGAMGCAVAALRAARAASLAERAPAA
jgi:predicted MFS family arabinose efflux permease